MSWTINSKVNGTTFRNNNTGLTPEQWACLKPGEPLILKADPAGATTGESHKDPYAIAIYHEKAGLLGYVPKDTAAHIIRDNPGSWASGRRAEVVELTGGTGTKVNRGINIKMVFQTMPEHCSVGALDPAGQDSWEGMSVREEFKDFDPRDLPLGDPARQ